MSVFEMAEQSSWKNFPKVIRNDDLGTIVDSCMCVKTQISFLD